MGKMTGQGLGRRFRVQPDFVILNIEFRIASKGLVASRINAAGIGGPQPPPGGGPQLVTEPACAPQAAARIGAYIWRTYIKCG